MNLERQINFWGHKQEYYVFSNFYPAPIVDNLGFEWPTTEHYYQAHKFKNPKLIHEVRNIQHPKNAAIFARNPLRPLREDWEYVKEGYMYTALRYKFRQHEDLKEILLKTKDADIVEDSPIDYYWGCGKTRTGHNRLGVMLMMLRYDLSQGEGFFGSGMENPYWQFTWKDNK